MSAAWLIGSCRLTDALAFDSGSARTVAAGSYYLKDSTDSISLLDAFQTALRNDEATAAVTLTRSGHVRITASSPFSITWTSTALRDFLGFTGTITSQTDVTATNHSSLWWSSGYPETPDAPAGVQGNRVRDTAINSSRSGLTTSFTTHNTRVSNGFLWDVVPIARVWTPSESPGEFYTWWETVASQGRAWKLWRNVAEDSSSSAEATSSSIVGPYKTTRANWAYSRQVQSADLYSRIRVPAVLVSELSNA